MIAATAYAQSTVGSGAPIRVLFIGNSLTASNDLPAVVARLADARSQPRPIVQMVAAGGFSLEDHWNKGDAQRAIIGGHYLAALVIYQGLYRRSPVGLPPLGSEARLLQDATVDVRETSARGR
jgi:hypothetical protein